MAYRLQFRKDTLEEWVKWNPQLADGEIGYIRGTNLYKIGEPWTKEEVDELPEEGRPVPGSLKFWNQLPTFGFNGSFSETLEDDGGDPSNEAVSKTVLVNKFADIESKFEKEISKLATKSELKANSDNLGLLEEGLNELSSNFEELSEIINNEEDGLIVRLNNLGTAVASNSDDITSLKNRLSTVEGSVKILTKTEYEQLVNNAGIEEGVLYYTYEENE